MRKYPLLRVTAIGLLGAVVPILVGAQDLRETTNRSHHEECTRAHAIARTGSLVEKEAAWRTLQQCDVTGPDALADAWRTGVDAEALQTLALASAGLKDARLFATLTEVAQGPTPPPLLRAAAIGVLAAYVDPSVRVRIAREGAGTSNDWSVSVGRLSHAIQTSGQVPITAAQQRRILDIIDEATRGTGVVAIVAKWATLTMRPSKDMKSS